MNAVLEAVPQGIRSRNYSTATTAQLSYEAESMTALNGAGTAALSGASGGSVISSTSFPAATWVSALYTNVAGAALTHVGTYRAWARCFSSAATPQFQLQWGVGALSVPTTNDPVRLPGTASFFMLDLGPVSIQGLPVGPTNWYGVIQTQVDTANDHVAIDRIFFQPLDEGAGRLQYVNVPPASSIAAAAKPSTGADDSSVGTLTWTSPGNITAEDGSSATISTGSGIAHSHYLKATGFGFSIPTGATIKGIAATVKRAASAFFVSDDHVKLVKAGTVQATDRAGSGFWSTPLTTASYGGVTDLWGGTWAASDINASNFGVVVAARLNAVSSVVVSVDSIAMTVYYQLSSGLTVSQDAVIYASRTVELRTDGMVRSDSGGTVYGPVSQVTGDLPRIPPSGLEGRAVEIFVKPTRGDLDTLPDSGLDGLSVIPKVRPSYLFRPTSEEDEWTG